MVRNKYKYVLASGSPRRRELLAGLGIDYEVRLIDGIDESYPSHLKGADIPLHISQAKSNAYRDTLQQGELIITADTIVWLDGEVIGKPRSLADAKLMLRKLSGRTHTVYTGVTLLTAEVQRSFSAETRVTFAELTGEEIDGYVDAFRPLDKAGSYGVQEWIGYIGVKSIEGSYFNVMGLPVQRLYNELKRI